MKKKYIKSTIILLLGGILTKILGMIIKITMSRKIGIQGVSLYSLVLPTFSLFISIGQIGLPITLSRFVALKTKNNKNLYFTMIPLIMFFNVLLSILIYNSSTFIGISLLKNEKTPILIKAISLVIPATTLSAVLRSYFFGKEEMLPHTLSNVIENITRLFLIWLISSKTNEGNIVTIVYYIILSNIISEGISILVLLWHLPKKIDFSKLQFQKNNIKETIALSLPNISNSLIGNIAFFLEPVLLTFFLTQNNTSLQYITKEYGVINGYILPLLMIPSFFSIAISQAILPTLSRLYQEKSYQKMKKMLKKSILLIITISLVFIIGIEFIGKDILKILYKTNMGYDYLKILAPIFLIYYLEHPLSFTLQALGKPKDIMMITIKTSILKLILLCLLSMKLNGIYPYIITMIINIILTGFLLTKKIFYYLKH